ncbi:MAG: VCBS repeat-containing protein, partial [Verrucomicrobiae bacterium]|nr:VCBS repeat-containing protein [Verrucomicrobiae bacterium]
MKTLVNVLNRIPDLSLILCGVLAWEASGDTHGADISITWQKHQLDQLFYSEGASFGDINGDGTNDIISGPWVYFGPEFSADKRVAIYDPKPFNKAGYSDNFFSFTRDFNGDGTLDVLVLGFPGKDASWFENPGKEALGKGFWKRNLVLEPVDNESPMFADLTGDGKPEIICSQNGIFGFAEPNPSDPAKPWTFRKITPEQSTGAKFTHGLGMGDVNGDGRMDLLEKNAWWEQPASLEGDPAWTRHLFAFAGAGGADMFAYDFDGDGDNDILTSLAAHGYGLVWYEQFEENGKKAF